MRRFAPFLMLAVLAACTESPTAPSDVEPLFAKGGVMHSATGSGHIETTSRRTFSFSANMKSDGSVSGQFNLVIHNDTQIRVHAEVTCMSVVGNRAYVGGVVKSASTPEWVGSETGWAVEDNGKSGDMISLMNIPSPTPGFAQSVCDAQSRITNFVVEGGNVRVR